MTIITSSTKAVAQGNGATTSWPYAFLIPAEADLVVTIVEIASGNPTVIPPSNFSVTGIGDPTGGAVTYPLSGSPLAATFDIVVERLLPLTQETDLTNQGGAYPQDIEDALDYLMMTAQQQQDQINRSIVFSVADTVETPLPLAAARANKFLGFNSSGDPVAVDGLTAGTTVSAAMIPVVTAATTAAALTALGLPGSLLDLLIPTGTVWDYTLTTAPTGFAFPIGQACTSAFPVYRAALVAAGSPFGTNGVDPLIPDLRSVVIAGKSNMGGVDNGLLPGGTVLGAVLGTATKTLITANLPAYTPTGANGAISVASTSTQVVTGPILGGNNVNQNISGGGGTFIPTLTTSNAQSGTLTSTGSGGTFTGDAQGGTSTAFSLVQPTFICNKIIKVH